MTARRAKSGERCASCWWRTTANWRTCSLPDYGARGTPSTWPGSRSATELLIATRYDVACLDLGLPDGDGIGWCTSSAATTLSSERPERIIITTARDAVRDRVAGLDAGADDYLVKPFAFAELTARVRALARRDAQPRREFRSAMSRSTSRDTRCDVEASRSS